MLIIVFIDHFTGQKQKAKMLLIFHLFLLFPIFYFLFNHLYVQYAIKNHNYYVEIDYIEDFNFKHRQYRLSSRSYDSYYVILKEHGKVKISKSLYFSLNKDDSVYVVIIKGLFKETYATFPIYPTENYIYEN